MVMVASVNTVVVVLRSMMVRVEVVLMGLVMVVELVLVLHTNMLRTLPICLVLLAYINSLVLN